MNNKGFGLQEFLVAIGFMTFLLVVVAIYINESFSSEIKQDNNYKIEEIADPIIKPQPIENDEYKNLENKLKSAAKKYSFNKNETIIISLDKLEKSNLINEMLDPNNKEIKCNGYVVYDSDKREYIPYLNCDGMYSTLNYNKNFE